MFAQVVWSNYNSYLLKLYLDLIFMNFFLLAKSRMSIMQWTLYCNNPQCKIWSRVWWTHNWVNTIWRWNQLFDLYRWLLWFQHNKPLQHQRFKHQRLKHQRFKWWGRLCNSLMQVMLQFDVTDLLVALYFCNHHR